MNPFVRKTKHHLSTLANLKPGENHWSNAKENDYEGSAKSISLVYQEQAAREAQNCIICQAIIEWAKIIRCEIRTIGFLWRFFRLRFLCMLLVMPVDLYAMPYAIRWEARLLGAELALVNLSTSHQVWEIGQAKKETISWFKYLYIS